ncbi:hypothetical protein I4U23_010960 [Adineta vaga]|nr:hypothetical protein I4U23_010960 [Adineta vaga]
MTNSSLYNGMIHQFTRMVIYGVIWYQGESNSGRNNDKYVCTFTNLVQSWRQIWNLRTNGITNIQFPFGFVQLSTNSNTTTFYGFPWIRWRQTFEIDLRDDPFDVHPRTKHDVGYRLSREGLAVAYGQKVEYQGPIVSNVNYQTDTNTQLLLLKYETEMDFNNNALSVTIKAPDVCNGKLLYGIRYLWLETSCPFKQAAIYNDQAQLTILFNLLIKTLAQCLDCFAWIIGNIGSVNAVPSWFCRFRFYIYYVAMASARYNIIFASADRCFCSSRKTIFRQLSSSKIALRLIIINALVWILFYIQALVTYDVQNNKCRMHSTSFFTYFNFFITIENGLFPIIPMSIFGLLTVHNIHQSKRRTRTIEPINGSQHVRSDRVSKKETQLHKMLINQVVIYLIFNTPLPMYGIYRSYLSIGTLSGWRALTDTFLNNLFYDMIYLGYALTFPIFILTSNIFRRELKQFIQTKIFKPCQQHIIREN